MRTRHLLAVFCLLAGAARAQDLNVISSVEVKDDGASVVVAVKGTRPPNFTTFSMADPPRFVIDLSESRFQGVPESVSVEDGVISVVKNLSYGAGSTSIARVMVAFVADVEPPDVQTVGNDLVVKVAKPAAAAGVALAAEAAAREKQDAGAAAQVEAEARAQAQVQAAAAAAAQERARAEAEAEAQARAEVEAQARQQAQAQAAAEAPPAAAEPEPVTAQAEAAPSGEKLGEEGVVTAPAEPAGPSPAEQDRLAREEAAAQAQAEAAAKVEAARRARAEADAARAAEVQAKADAKARAAEEARARKQAEADARAAALAEKKAAAEAAAAEKKAKAAAAAEARAAAAAEKKAAAEAAKQAAAEARKAAAEAKAAKLAAAGPASRLAEIGFKQLPGASRVFVRTSAAPRFTVTDVGDDTVRVELENTRATRRNDTRFLDTSFFASPVALITPSMKGSAYVVDIKLRQRVPYQQKVEGDMLAIDFERPTAAAEPAPAGDAPPADAGTLALPPEPGTVVAPAEPEADPAPKQ